MTRFALTSSIITILVALAIAARSSPSAAANTCARTSFKTELVKQACAKGGQPAAKDAMKAFNKDKKIKSCNQCHAKLAPSYELKPDALDQFKKLGGK
jgi:hypothetical protein